VGSARGGDGSGPSRNKVRDEAAEATLRASRALLGVVARSLAPVLDQVSLPQFRVLVILREGGSKRSGLLAEQLGVHPSTFTRMADRLVAAGWVERQEAPDNRREVHVALTESGAALVEEVMQRRREAIGEVLAPLSQSQRQAILTGLGVFADAAGEPAVEDLSTLGL
jgi:DNA-binding MarR family transcriptional regulator